MSHVSNARGFNVNPSLNGSNVVSTDSFNIDDLRSEKSLRQRQTGGGGLLSWLAGSDSQTNLVLSAFKDKRPDVAVYLLNKHKCDDISATDESGKNILHYLVIYSTYDTDVAKLLSKMLNYDAIDEEVLNAQDVDGNTPAHYAADLGNSIIVEALKRKGADLTLKNKHEFYVGTDTETDPDVADIYEIQKKKSCKHKDRRHKHCSECDSDKPSRDRLSEIFVSKVERPEFGKGLDNIIKLYV